MTTEDLDATHAAALAVTTCAVDAVLAPHRKIDYDMLNVALGSPSVIG